ncbi:MAG: hypothetical protein WD638_10760 [Nitriliruptoraceae bacterium]
MARSLSDPPTGRRLPSPPVPDDDAPRPHPASEPRVRIVLLAGPSGSGKSHLAARTGIPTLCLDDFYRDGDEPALPTDAEGRVDWDDVRAWDAGRAMAALQALASEGHAELPRYDISRDRTVGSHHLDVGTSPIVIAEGIFAAELIPPCRDAGLLADAVCLVHHPTRTFWRRLVRDLREGRKAPITLMRRGWALRRAEPDIVAHHLAMGARPVTGHQAEARLAHLAAHSAPAPAVTEHPGRDAAA